MAQEPQTFKNHARFDPGFHFFLAPITLFLVIEEIVRLVRNPNWNDIVRVVAALAALVAVFKIRLYALKVQDRVIRLEERLRFKELLPAPLQGRVGQLSEGQLVALRFASDGEVSGLVEKALDGKWNPKQIKAAIRVWRPDYWRV